MIRNKPQNQIERLTWYFGIEKPIIVRVGHLWQTPELIAEAAESGALGVLCAGLMSAAEIKENVSKIRMLTDKPFAVEIFPEQKTKLDEEAFRLQKLSLQPLREDLGLSEPIVNRLNFEEQFKALLDLEIPIVGTCLGGLREPYMEVLEEKDIKVYGVACNLKDCKVLVASGVKTIIAQGFGAAGLHSFCEERLGAENIDSLTLYSELDRALKIPFAVEGSCVNKKQVKAVLAMGASAIVLSDALLRARESAFPTCWREKISYFSDAATRLNSYGMGRPSRSLYTGIFESIEENEVPVLEFPYQWFAMQDIFKKAAQDDLMELAYIEMGQSAYQSKEGKTSEIINETWEWIKENE